MTEIKKKIWFPAKRYGWGWGFPICWQGWVVFGVYFALLLGASFLLLPKYFVFFYLFMTPISVLLIAICWLKGEKPCWRWGKG